MGLELSLEGRVAAVVGGGGGGIGTAVCLRLAEAGADVIAISVVADDADQTAASVAELGRRSSAQVADVTDADALVAALDAGAAELGVIDILVNVVGGTTFPHWHRLLDYDLDSFDALIATNLRYALVASKHIANGLVDAERRGSIVHISSIASRGAPLLAAYGAAKAGLDSLTHTMAAEWGRYGIRTNGVAPGTINTPRAGRDDLVDPAAAAIPLGRRGHPNDIANAVVFLASDLSSYISGHTIVVDGGSSHRGGHLDDADLPTFVTNPKIRERFAPLTDVSRPAEP